MKSENTKNLLLKIKNSSIIKVTQEPMPNSLLPIFFKRTREKELMHSELMVYILNEALNVKGGEPLFGNFLKMISLHPSDINLEDLRIDIERGIVDDRRIDILITWRDENAKQSYAIIIENKLNNASDQPNQLIDYYKAIIAEGYEVKKILYLPNWETSKAKSIGIKEADELLMNFYPKDLIAWLEDFLRGNSPIEMDFKRNIEDYITMLKLTDMENQRIEENFELVNILGQNKEDILYAHKIYQKWNDIKWHTEWDFWNQLKENLKEEFEVLNGQLFSPEYLTNAIHRKQNRKCHYGITIKVMEKDSRLICIYMERGLENMYYGIVVKTANEEWCNKEDEVFNWLSNQLNSKIEHIRHDDIIHTSLWVTSKYFEEEINFESFSKESTLKLINPEYSLKTIKSILKQVKTLRSELLNINQ